uniref:Nudix hydrolase domain-containing protein n=1 Tax=Neobodo designis TaxID=312471 RepID=A0A7S1LQQ9_NEODS|mmetsp:Transcript_26553/g.82058  ORF Transcript_26553/g.82058 Transcript_26553/m.82058 type:complete len:301 (+) Transcript_26553:38-940(+)
MGVTRSKPLGDGVKAPALAAATVCLAPFKENAPGFRVCMVKRASTMKFMPNTYVFPGGRVDPKDADLAEDVEHIPETYSHRMERVAAVRELFEETGILMNQMGTPTNAKFSRFTPDHAHLLVPFQRWVTPAQEKRRFDTYFFMLQMRHDFPEKFPLIPQEGEIADAIWIEPKEALRRHADPAVDFKLPPPTFLMLHKLSEYQTAAPAVHEHLMEYGSNMGEIPRLEPIIKIAKDGVFELHFPHSTLHLHEGVHIFPGNYTPKEKLPEGVPEPDEWRVIHGSDMWDPLSQQLRHPPPDSKL